jgi:hypothetical protein
MMSDVNFDIRPRGTGDILDDAFRLSLADWPTLLALDGLFFVPAAVVVLLLLALPAPENRGLALVWPALAALLLPTSGLGSGACQELLRRRAEGLPVSLSICLHAALACGLDHVAARALVLLGGILGLACLLVPGLAIWMCLSAVHPLLAAGEMRLGEALRESTREAQRNAGKATAVLLGRLALFLFAILSLHVLVRVMLWSAGNLAGMDVGLLGTVLVSSNPVYALSIILFAWWLLAPFGEACNYLLHLDTRVRYEGLDIWHRVRRLFPLAEAGATRALLMALGILVLSLSPLQAADSREQAIQESRQALRAIRNEVQNVEPYPGGSRWEPRLRSIWRMLNPDGKRRGFAWLDKDIAAFVRSDRKAGLDILHAIDERLGLIEDTLVAGKESPAGVQEVLSAEDTRRLLPDRSISQDVPKAKNEEPKQRKQEDRELESRDAGHRGPGIVAPGPGGGFEALGWLVLAGLLLACVVVAVVLLVQQRRRLPKARRKQTTVTKALSPESLVTQPDQLAAASLWQQADDLARQGNCLEALRLLYLGVLALLHRAHLIRYEKTRTNGEYVQQVRRANEASPNLQAGFKDLTRWFDQKWYGQRACGNEEYHSCRELAEQVRSDLSP